MSGSVTGDAHSAADNVEMDTFDSTSNTGQTPTAGGFSDGTPPAQRAGPQPGVITGDGDTARQGECSCCPGAAQCTRATIGQQAAVTSSSSSGTNAGARVLPAEPAQQDTVLSQSYASSLHGDHSCAGGNLAENMEDEILADAGEQYLPVGLFAPRSADSQSHAQGRDAGIGTRARIAPVQQLTTSGGGGHGRTPPKILERYRTWARRDLGLGEEALKIPIKVIEGHASPSTHERLPTQPETITLGEYRDRLARSPDNVVRVIILEREQLMKPNPNTRGPSQVLDYDKSKPLEKVFRLPSDFWTTGRRQVGGTYKSYTHKVDSSSLTQQTLMRESLLILRGKIHKELDDGNGPKDVFEWVGVHFFLRSLPGSVELFFLAEEREHSEFKWRLIDALSSPRKTSRILADPFIFHVLIFEKWRKITTNSFWRLRDLIEAIEKKSVENDEPNYAELHNIAKHVIQLIHEIAPNNLNLATAMRDDYKATQLPLSGPEDFDWFEDADSAWTAFRGTFQHIEETVLAMRISLNAWMTLEKRVNNQMDLAYNLVQSRNSDLQRDIAHATRTDSIAMKTISIVTLLFLPATAIGTVFSMPFFETESDMVVSRDLWIFWAFTIPITLLTLAIWYVWQNYAVRKMQEQKETAAAEKKKQELQNDQQFARGRPITATLTGFSSYSFATFMRRNPTSVPGSPV